MSQPRIAAIILAAGKGTRLKSELPKVLHEVLGRPMLAYVFDACRAAGVAECFGVIGHGKDRVIETFRGDDGDISWVEQAEQLGTGHAVMVCREAVLGKFDHVVLLCGDGPLIRSETIRTLIDEHLAKDSSATLATAEIPDPTGYGRITRAANGELEAIVEHKECTPEQLKIHEVNPSYYCFCVDDLFAALDQTNNDNAKGEYYVTDVIEILIGAGKRALAITAVPPEDIFSINSRKDLALVNGVMRDRINARLMDDGVTIVDPANTWIDARAEIGRDTVIHPFVVVSGPAQIAANCTIGPFAEVDGDARIADGAVVRGDCGVGAAR